MHRWGIRFLVNSLLLLGVIGFMVGTVRAQFTPSAQDNPFAGGLLESPVIAATPSQQDRIVLYDITSHIQRELSFGAGEHQVWDFSPDGCRILYTLGDPLTLPRLYSARLDGTDVRELVQYNEIPADGWGVWEPDWSPDGEKIALTMIRDTVYLQDIAREAEGDTREYRVAWIPSAGGEITYYSVSGDEHTPRWSPTGDWLGYIAYEERAPGADIQSTAVPTPEGSPPQNITLLREADLWMVRQDGAEKFRLTYFDTGSVTNPQWSPDSELIGFVYSPIGNNDQFWMVASRAGAIPTQLSFQWTLALDLTWLPNSAAMLGAIRDFQSISENRLWQIPLAGDADFDATQYVADSTLQYLDFPRFSPDGRWLALRSEYALTLLDTTDSTWRILDATPGNTPPVWSPAGFAGEANC
jgi:Tol biopolymer transport system component